MGCSFAIVGCGKVGKALGKFLAAAGYDAVGTASKSRSSAKEAADLLNTGRYSDIPWEITPSADVVLITTPDGAIADTCRLIAENKGFKSGCVVLHCSGALPSTILSSAGRCGAFQGRQRTLGGRQGWVEGNDAGCAAGGSRTLRRGARQGSGRLRLAGALAGRNPAAVGASPRSMMSIPRLPRNIPRYRWNIGDAKTQRPTA